MACSVEEAPRCRAEAEVVVVVEDPGHCYGEVGAVEEKQHGRQHTTNNTLYGPTTWEAKLIVMTTRGALRANDIHHLALGA